MKPNIRRIVIVIFLLIVTALAVTAELVLRRRADSESGGRTADLVLSDFRPEDVRTVEVSFSPSQLKSTLTFMPDGRYWALKERADAQAASTLIAELLENLAKTEPLKELNISGLEDYRELHLVSADEISAADEKSDPKRSDLEKETGILVVLRDAQGAELLRMMLGGGFWRTIPDRIGQSGQPQDPDARYVRVWYPDRTSRVFLISRLFKNCVPRPTQWLEQLRFFKADNPWSAEFLRKRSGADEFSTVWSVATDENGQRFRSEFPRGEFDLDLFSQKFQALASQFSVDRMADLPEELQFREMFHAVMRDGFDYKLELAKAQVAEGGEADVEVCLGRLTVAFDPEKVRPLIGEPDDALEHRKKQLASRAEYEMRTANGYVFLLKNGLLELLSQPPVKPSLRTSTPRPATPPAPQKEE